MAVVSAHLSPPQAGEGGEEEGQAGSGLLTLHISSLHPCPLAWSPCAAILELICSKAQTANLFSLSSSETDFFFL